jgi:hypothetical protein
MRSRRQPTFLLEVYMKSNQVLCLTSFVMLIVLAGCGYGSFDPNNVTVTLSPATATVSADGQVPLQATVHHNCTGCTPLYNWLIAENGDVNCSWIADYTPPAGPCPGGTLQQPEALPGGTVTYFAPSTPGKFHVTAQSLYFTNILGPPTTTKQATSVITVRP